jgi:hypothetical protein
VSGRAVAARPVRPLAAASACIASLLLAPAAFGAGPADGGRVSAEGLNAGTQRVLDYWTPARMRQAEPLTVEPPSGGSPAAPRSARPPTEPVVIPPAAPPDWEPADIPAPPAADRQSGPIPYASVELTDTTSYPNRVHGNVFMTMGRGDYSCSGTVVNSTSGGVVMTAGHCVHEGGKGGPWARHVLFVPGYQDAVAPFGGWVARRLFTTKPWRKRARFYGDIGAAALNPNELGQTVEAAIGARGIGFNLPREQAYRSYGYPLFPRPKFDGESLWACDSSFGYVDTIPKPVGPPPSAIGCDMGAGSSGGAWVIDDTTVVSSISYGYAFLPEVVFGPYYGDLAMQVYGMAQAG